MEERGTQTQPREGSLSSDFMKTPGSALPDAPRSSPQSWGSPTWNTALHPPPPATAKLASPRLGLSAPSLSQGCHLPQWTETMPSSSAL